MPNITGKDLKKLDKTNQRYKKQNEYLKTKYDRLNIAIPYGRKEDVKKAADAVGLSVNAFCSNLIMSAIDQTDDDSSDMPDCFK